ncbi:MAG: DUF1501 domain-containing protein [Phycisphaeraceae bacterium]
MSPTRRQFLAGSSAFMGAAALGLSPEALANALRSQGHPPTLVTIYLRGGADPLNAICPAGDPQYFKVRPTIAIPARSDNPNNPAVIPLTNVFGLHPSLKPLHALYEKDRMAAIMSTGSTHPTRSHFDAQDFMERAAPGIKSVTEGWLNRYLTATRSEGDPMLRAMAMQPTLPRSLRGQYPVLAVPVGGADRAMNAFERMYSCDGDAEARKMNGPSEPKPDETPPADPDRPRVSGTPAVREIPKPEDDLHETIVEAGEESIDKLRHLNGIVRGQSDGKYPDSRLARQLADVAKVIKAGEGLEVAAVDYNGWDHHAYQGGSTGTMANMLTVLAEAIRAFHDDLGAHMDKTLVLVMSEFGRTVYENGNNGSDHGRGGFMLAVGGMVKGGRLYGKYTGLEKQNLYQNRDLPVHVDFRLVFAEALYALFGFEADKTDFFPEYQTRERPVGYLHPIAAG